jgi:hypothetical protein
MREQKKANQKEKMTMKVAKKKKRNPEETHDGHSVLVSMSLTAFLDPDQQTWCFFFLDSSAKVPLICWRLRFLRKRHHLVKRSVYDRKREKKKDER